MNRRKLIAVSAVAAASLLIGPPARADLFGADVAVLSQILAESIKQYYQLREIIGTGKDNLEFLRALNTGIDNSIGLLDSLPIKDEKVLSEIREFREAKRQIENLYGRVPHSPDEALELLQDQTVAESLRMANDFKEYSEKEEMNSTLITTEVRGASPKGAARIQAETSAEILKSLSQLLRLNTQILKLDSEQLALKNKSEKEAAGNFVHVGHDMGAGFRSLKVDMELPRF